MAGLLSFALRQLESGDSACNVIGPALEKLSRTIFESDKKLLTVCQLLEKLCGLWQDFVARSPHYRIIQPLMCLCKFVFSYQLSYQFALWLLITYRTHFCHRGDHLQCRKDSSLCQRTHIHTYSHFYTDTRTRTHSRISNIRKTSVCEAQWLHLLISPVWVGWWPSD